MKTYKYTAIRKRFLQFCKKNNISPDEMLYGCCEGSLSNFPYWYADYIKYIRGEISNRVKTGVYRKIDIREVWRG